MTPKISKVEVVENYKLILYFETGEKKLYDMKKNFKYECFKNLRNWEIFKTVKAVGETIEWETGEDINPEELYFNSKPMD